MEQEISSRWSLAVRKGVNKISLAVRSLLVLSVAKSQSTTTPSHGERNTGATPSLRLSLARLARCPAYAGVVIVTLTSLRSGRSRVLSFPPLGKWVAERQRKGKEREHVSPGPREGPGWPQGQVKDKKSSAGPWPGNREREPTFGAVLGVALESHWPPANSHSGLRRNTAPVGRSRFLTFLFFGQIISPTRSWAWANQPIKSLGSSPPWAVGSHSLGHILCAGALLREYVNGFQLPRDLVG
jgi:hypothetical protein